MPVICYSPRFHEAEITMDRTAGRELAEIIARGEGELAGDQTADPSPYEELLDAVRVAPAPSGSEGKVVLGLSDDGKTLTITGAREHLAVLAKVVRELADDPDLRPITHVHVEYFEGHYYLAESEVSIVLRVAV
jgi:hypothetical protein